MSEKLTQLEEQLKVIRKGLFLMGTDRIRALSTHETEDLIASLEETAEQAQKIVADLASS